MSTPARNTHHYSQSTPSKPSPLREDITDMIDALDINEVEKTPTQAVILRESQPTYPQPLEIPAWLISCLCCPTHNPVYGASIVVVKLADRC
jgi:hypothetical protein